MTDSNNPNLFCSCGKTLGAANGVDPAARPRLKTRRAGVVISPSIDFHSTSTLAAVDAAIFEIDSLDRPAFAGEVYRTTTCSFGEAVTQVWAEFLVIAEGYHHVGYFDWRVFNLDLKLLVSTFAPPDLDLIMVASEVDFTLAQTFPAVGRSAR
jgi:hypothetical protein